MLQIGITGGMGAGKSTVCRMFEALGVPVYDSDSRAKILMQEDEQLIADIKTYFGDEVFDNEGKLQRQILAEKVFSDSEKLEKLNSLVHPAVMRDNMQWAALHATKNYVLKESALLFETGIYLSLDRTILVAAPLDLRVERIIKRDQCSAEEAMARINKQMPEEEKRELADFVIENDQEHALLPQVLEIHKKIQDLCHSTIVKG